jgi:DNA-binding NarL/FixJ family response regulator
VSTRSRTEVAPERAGTRRFGVIVVDPLPVVRAGTSLLIADHPDMEVLAEACTADEGIEAISRVRRTRVVVLIGLGLAGDHDAYWLIRTIRSEFPSHALIACGANADPTMISRALFVGADGFVDKNLDPAEFLDALRRASEGEMVLGTPAATEVDEIAIGIQRNRDTEVRLTERERQVLAVAAQGLTARQIASELGVRERTITTHLARIYGKLGVGNRLSAVRLAAQSGLVSVGVPE